MAVLDDVMRSSEELSLVQVINELLRPENIRMKTEIPNVSALLKLRVLSKWLKQNQLDDAAELIDIWIENFVLDMVSSGRQSRKEVADMVKALRGEESEDRDFMQRLEGGPK